MGDTPRPDGPRATAEVTVLAQAAPQRVLTSADARELWDLIAQARETARELALCEVQLPRPDRERYVRRDDEAFRALRQWINDRTGA